MSRWTHLLGLTFFATTALAAEARADTPTTAGVPVVQELPPPETAAVEPPAVAPVPDAPAVPSPFKARPFVAVWGGIGFANVVHPDLGTPHVYGPLLAFQVGYRFSPRWALSLEVTNLDSHVARSDAAERFGASASFLRTQASCDNCAPPALGGAVASTTMLLDTVGPRVDFTPFGPQGFYLGASGGVAIITLLDPRVGAGGTARAGYAFNIADALHIGIEGGVQGQAYAGASALMGYGALSLLLPVLEAPSARKTGAVVR